MEGSRIIFKYCLEHEKEVIAHYDYQGKLFHLVEHYPYIPGLGDDVCYSEFTECPPPEMTEEYWEQIFAMEGANNGTEITI